MKSPRAWRRSAVNLPDPFEAHLEQLIHERSESALLSEMLRYHLGLFERDRLRRGKRLRPKLLFAIVQELGGRNDDALDAGVAIEVLHNYSLVHDDIEDGDRYRHGRQTLWAKYGTPQAINAGDALCALSYLSLLKTAQYHSPARVTAMMHALHRANFAMCEGQSLDIAFESEGTIDTKRYLRMIAGKTAALFGAAAELGAYCSGAGEADVEHYGSLGRSFGIAFQINDDILGIWGDEQDTGKTAGADIARRKKSFPIVWAMQRGLPGAKTIADVYSGDERIDADAIQLVMDALEAAGAREASEHEAAERLSAARESSPGVVRDFLLNALPLTTQTQPLSS
ncbi:MAG: polyprenyl synthetase family protein [Candidatus Eremiobacteraeota bacterium]|nr:polyprenyl synthetase family protein [Candidatus Eremiobacteraeota bacterium]